MNKILFSIYTDKYPNANTGGPNNIIFKLINSSLSKKYKTDYLSSDLFSENLFKGNIKDFKKNRSIKKKAASFLTANSSLYRKIFSSDFYLPIHYYKKNRYYKSFKNKSIDYDIIHSQDSISLSLITDRKSKAKKILTVHSKGALSDELKNMFKSVRLKEKFDKKFKEYERQSIKLADVITFPSNAAKNYFERSLDIKIDENKTKIIYNGIDLQSIQNIPYDDENLEKFSIKKIQNRIILLNIAAHSPEKKMDVLLKVIAKLKYEFNKDIVLINIGEENKRTKGLLLFCEKLAIQKNVKFLGKLPNVDVIKLLKASDIFIMTSKRVIFDLVVLEALACGTCCVVSNDGGNREIIKDGENGYLIDTNDTDKIAEKIISIDINKTKRKAIETAKQFSVKKMVDEYFNLYDSLL